MGSSIRLGSWRRVALGALIIGAAVCTAAAIDAWRVDPLPIASASESAGLGMPDMPQRVGPTTESVILAAIAKDPFRSDRKRPRSRYRLPGERRSRAKRAARVAASYARLRLLGTAVVPGGKDLAAFHIPGRPSWVVGIGQVVQGLELVEVHRGAVTLTGRDTTLILRTAGPTGEARKR